MTRAPHRPPRRFPAGDLPVLAPRPYAQRGTAWAPVRHPRYAADASAFHDALLDIDCTIHVAADGVERCLPHWKHTADAGVGYFSDPACTVGAARSSYDGYGCAVRYADEDTGPLACTPGPSSRRRIHALGARLTQPPFYKSGSSCTRESASSWAWTDYVWYELGPEVPPSTFVRFTRR